MVGQIEELSDTPIFSFVPAPHCVADLENLIAAFKFAKPYADCVFCQQQGCARCRDRGWIPRPLYHAMTDDDQAASLLRGKGK